MKTENNTNTTALKTRERNKNVDFEFSAHDEFLRAQVSQHTLT